MIAIATDQERSHEPFLNDEKGIPQCQGHARMGDRLIHASTYMHIQHNNLHTLESNLFDNTVNANELAVTSITM